MYNPFSLEGKTILVTGASSGIGKTVAIECSKLGAKVIITARNEQRLQDTLMQMHGTGHQMIICDLSCEQSINEMVDLLPEIQGLVNNAGFTKLLPLQFISEKDITDLMKVNTIAPILLLQKLLKKKKIKKGVSVVFTSSMAGLGFSTIGNSMYTACKGAITSFIRCAALELAHKSIRVNAVCPGMVESNILAEGVVTQEQVEKDKLNYPLGRYGKPEDVAYAMIYLLSDASKWVTGTNMVIDGGYSIR